MLFTICPQDQICWTRSDPASAVPLFADPVLDCFLASRSGIANASSYRCGYEVFGSGSAEVVADHQAVLPYGGRNARCLFYLCRARSATLQPTRVSAPSTHKGNPKANRCRTENWICIACRAMYVVDRLCRSGSLNAGSGTASK
jgi:hypothetical protein